MPATAGPPPIVARSIYVVRPDPRLCPSPLCGGYWVAIANRSRTRCHDRLLRPRCYVATAIDIRTRQPLTSGLTAYTLARAVLGTWPVGSFGELGAVWVDEAWQSVGQTPPTGDFFRLRDTGIRCIRAPCFSTRVGRIHTSSHTTTVSGVDLGSADADPKTLNRADAALRTPEVLLASGRIAPTTDGGRVFRASQIYLKLAKPRG
ncbi:hypothetical protein BH09ACT13_BH09ACT13_09390 [soil metagenome]